MRLTESSLLKGCAETVGCRVPCTFGNILRVLCLVWELWEQEGLIHNDVSLGNVGSCLSRHEASIREPSLVQRAKDIIVMLETQVQTPEQREELGVPLDRTV